MRHTAHNKNNTLAVFALVTAVVLVAGYAAITRFDRLTGPPQAPLEALQPEPPVAKQTVDSPPKDKKPQATDPLTETVHALIAEEQALPEPDHVQPSPSSDAPVATATAVDAPASLPPAAAQAPDVIGQARAKVAEAEALLREGGYPQTTAPSTAASRQRSERISELRRQLAEINAGLPPSGQQ